MKKNKFKKSYQLLSLDEVWEEVRHGRYIYYKNRPIHPRFIENMNLKSIMGGVKNNLLFAVKLNDDVTK